MRTIEWHVEQIVSASKETMYFINFETEDLRSNQKFPVVGALSDTGGFTDDMKKRIHDVALVIGEPASSRKAEDTDVTYTRKKKEQKEYMKEYLAEVVDLLVGDDLGLPFSMVDDVLFADYEDENIQYVKADFSMVQHSNNKRRGGFINIDTAAGLVDC